MYKPIDDKTGVLLRVIPIFTSLVKNFLYAGGKTYDYITIICNTGIQCGGHSIFVTLSHATMLADGMQAQ